uniref:MIP06817p n=1 Tax=Drosophila melanogaster TaxID=7227 RepID=C0PUY7_DROME|nr:MIP06817p [Drosophila melanogaster]
MSYFVYLRHTDESYYELTSQCACCCFLYITTFYLRFSTLFKIYYGSVVRWSQRRS